MYFHYQDLKKDDRTKHLLHGRCWIGRNNTLSLSWSVPSAFWHIYIELNECGGDDAISFSIASPLFALWVGLEHRGLYNLLEKLTKRKNRKYTDGRKIGVSFHGGTFWFSLWEDMNEWDSNDPKWWKFNFNAMDFFFGRAKYREEIVSEGDTVVDMPEGIYKATYKKFISYWKRPRLFSESKITRMSIDVPIGIPHEGKGENSWDCGMDATFGSTFPISENTTIGEACDQLAVSCLKTRQKYGSLNSSDYLKWKQDREEKLSNLP